MRWAEISEARQAPLYHFMDARKALVVFEQDAMAANWMHVVDGRQVKGNSFSRNKNYSHGAGSVVRLHADQLRLSARNKIIPVDGEIVFRHTGDVAYPGERAPRSMKDLSGFMDRKINSRRLGQDAALQEEFVVGEIKPLSKVLLLIEVLSPNFYHISGQQAVTLLDAVRAYAEQHQVELSIHPRFIENVEEIKARWADDD